DRDYLAKMEENLRLHASGEDVPPCECIIVSRTGKRIDAILTSKSISYDGAPAVLALVTDITTRKRSERLLLALNTAAFAMEQALTPLEVFPAALHPLVSLGFDCAVLLSDTEGARELRAQCSASAATGEMTAAVAGAAGGLSFDAIRDVARAMDSRTALLASLELRDVALLFGDAVATGRAATAPTIAILSPLVVGESVSGLLVAAADDLGDGDIPLFTAFARQIAATWRKARLVVDLEKSLEQLRQMQNQLLHAQKMEAIGRLAGGIAHDFNNLLTVISGYASLLTDSMTGNEPALADLAQIRSTIKRASALTSRLLAFSRKQILQPVILDMNKVMSASVALLRPLIGEDIDLVVKASPAVLYVRADPYQMEQVLMNLAVNARDAMPAGGMLLLRTDSVTVGPGCPPAPSLPPDLPSGAWVVLIVRDNGVGMSEETRLRIFEPFFTTKEEGKGSGLGLSTVYGIVTQSGGHVRVDSALGSGTTFTICLPMASADTPATLEEDRPRSLSFGSGTVLLVEDEADVRELARRVLERGGYNVIPVVSAREALLIAEGSAVLDLVLTDVVMPGGMSGLEMGERLSRTRPELPVLYMSGYSEELRVPSRAKSEVAAFLGKPFRPDELLARVKVMVKR
ncbi:MAG TPA: ATP-binding protein, partial [Spirochaetia bacterium]